MQIPPELLEKNIDSIYPSKEEFERKLESSDSLKIYLGIDPSSPKIHLGHAIILSKLREFQKLGHEVILLVGDFTGMIGDPTDKSATRKQLTRGEVVANSETYLDQAAKILDFEGENKAKIEFNSKWLDKLTMKEIIDLTSRFTIQQFLERDMFQKRIAEKKPIGVHEFLYPLMQGYDSVALETDIEIGGTDQTFNMLVGRQLLKEFKNKEKFVLTTPLLEGTDGRKMSKSFENTVDLTDDPVNMYGKIMSLKDELIWKYFEMVTDLSVEELGKLRTETKDENPINLKKKLAFTLVSRFHSQEKAKEAESEFTKVVQEKGLPSVIEEIEFEKEILPKPYSFFLTETGLCESTSEAIRLGEQGGVFFDDDKITNVRDLFETNKSSIVVRAGKRKFKTLIFK